MHPRGARLPARARPDPRRPVPLHAELFVLLDRGLRTAWRAQRPETHGPAPFALPPVGRPRPRPRSTSV